MIDEVLTALSLARLEKRNPNSGNIIGLWILESDNDEDHDDVTEADEAEVRVEAAGAQVAQ